MFKKISAEPQPVYEAPAAADDHEEPEKDDDLIEQEADDQVDELQDQAQNMAD